MKITISGFFNPLHSGHLIYMEEAKKLGDTLLVIVNNDFQVQLKGSVPFMTEVERAEIIKSIKWVDEVFIAIDKDITVNETLKLLKPDIFAKGGDRTLDNIPEKAVCEELGIKMIFGIGGEKIQSSSSLLKNQKYSKRIEKPWGYFNVLLEGKGWWFKRLEVNDETSLQSHEQRDEIFVIYVPKGTTHKISGHGELYELAIGNPKEEDIKRISDKHNRI